MNSCIMFYEHINRDMPMLLNIKDEIEKNYAGKIKVAIFSVTFEWPDSITYAKKQGVDLVVFPWMRWSPHFEFARSFYRINNAVRYLILNQEQLGSPCSIRLLLPQNDFAMKGTYHCAWTQDYSNELVRAGVPESHVFVTGNAKLDSIDLDVSNKELLAQRYHLDPEKKWILYAESRNVAVLDSDYFRSKQRFCGIPEDEIEGQRKYYVNSLDAFGEQLNNLSKEFLETYEFIYRLHPGQSLPFVMPPGVREISELPIGQWVTSCDLFVTFNSTSAFEAEFAGTPVVVHNPTPVDSRFQMKGIGLFPNTSELEHVYDCMLEAYDGVPESRIGEQYIGVPGSDAAEKIAKVAGVLATAAELELEEKPPTFSQKAGATTYVKSLVSKYVVKLNLLDKLRWPNIAYRGKTDLPPDWLVGKAPNNTDR